MEDRVMSIVVRFKPTSLTAATYDESTRQLEEAGVDPRPEGLDRHICFGTDGNLQVIEIWDSREQFEAFGERLAQLPVLAELGIEFSAPPEILEIHRIVKREADIANPS
jgi:hypothetical protein